MIRRIKQELCDNSIRGKMYRLMLQMFIPLLAVFLIILAMLFSRNYYYRYLTSNIVEASRFNQDFKNEVDLKMYLYVSGGSDELPTKEVEAAHALSEKLLGATRNSESRKAMLNVLSLCDNLEKYIERIRRTEGYEDRMEQLDTNIYVITGLIQEHIYTYLFYEAGEMAETQKHIDQRLLMETVVISAVILIATPLAIRKALLINRSITEPIAELSERVEQIGQGDLTERVPVETKDPGLANLSRGIEAMAGKLKRQIELNRQEQIRLRGIELSLLQAQINPHFLYNTLDAIVWLIEIGRNEQAEQMITSLSEYFRAFLSDGKDIVTIAQEKQHVQSYLEIQQVRYRDILEYEMDICPDIEQFPIPKLTLQPLVENAIYHGLKPKRGKGKISVLGCRSGDRIVLLVRDTGAGMNAEQLEELRRKIAQDDSSSFGLVASNKRLRLLYGEDCVFRVDSEQGVGTTITIQIPYRLEEAEHETVL